MTRHERDKSGCSPLLLLLLLLAALFVSVRGAAQNATLPQRTDSTTSSAASRSNATASTQSSTSKPGKFASSHKPTAVPSATVPSHTSASASSTNTCRSASLNYITNRLPQQCWTGSASSASTAAVMSDSAVTGSSGPVTATATHESEQLLLALHNSSVGAIAADSLSGPQSSPGTESATQNAVSATVKLDLAATPQVEPEAESLLDDAEFLSFEEWKKKKQETEKNNQNAGASTDDQQRKADRRPGIENALDDIQDDGEIYLDLSGFGGSNRPKEPTEVVTGAPSQHTTENAMDALPETAPRLSKDAGRTCKERTNYASFDCAANVLKTNPKCKSASSILVENKDSYMLNECKLDNKFLIVELCENIIIDTVVLANFEFFSSIFRSFKISVSDRYPVKMDKWQDLGTFEARNTREIQPFLIKSCPIFAKYLRIEFLTHYGSEYYCPVSLLRVHGTTMYEDWRRTHQDRDTDEEAEMAASSQAQEAKKANSADSTPQIVANDQAEVKDAVTNHTMDATAAQPSARQSVPTTVSPSLTGSSSICNSSYDTADEPSVTPTLESCPTDDTSTNTTSKIDKPTTSESVPQQGGFSNATNSVPTTPVKKSSPSSSSVQTSIINANSSSAQSSIATSNGHDKARVVSTVKFDGSVTSKITSTSTLTATPHQATASQAPTPYQPPTQESFFKSIHKRLLFLEANSTLSLQYIEAQSALLRDAFAKVEKRQINKTSSFLESLNATVTAELAKFKSDYDRLWQSAVMELASQREESRKEREMLGERVRVLAEEMGNQKRLMAAQATIMLLCLGLVVFGKFGSVPATIDTGLLQGVQEIVAKAKEAKLQESPNAKKRWRWDSPFASPARRSKSSPMVNEAPKQQRNLQGHHQDADKEADSSPETTVTSSQADTDSLHSKSLSHQLSPPGTALPNHRSAPTTPNG